MSKIKYFNFPIYFLEGFLINSQESLERILYFSLYSHSLKLELGSYFENFQSSAKFYNVTLGDAAYACEQGEQLFDDQIPGYPKVGINTKIFWDYYKYQKSCFQNHTVLNQIVSAPKKKTRLVEIDKESKKNVMENKHHHRQMTRQC